jgi:hypothetical protein
MLILDKRKAVDHIVALAAQLADTAAVEAPVRDRPVRRFEQKVATFERRSAPRDVVPAKPRRRPARRRASAPRLAPA